MPNEDRQNNTPIEFIIEYDGWRDIGFNPIEFGNLIYNKIIQEFEDANGEICVLLADDEKLHELNKTWRFIDKPTNVLSFPHDGGGQILGDIAISLQTLQKEAIEQNKSLQDHFAHLLIHGILHLLGFDHINEDEAIEMETIEIELLESLNISNPYEMGVKN